MDPLFIVKHKKFKDFNSEEAINFEIILRYRLPNSTRNSE